jgi:hypothetical protein
MVDSSLILLGFSFKIIIEAIRTNGFVGLMFKDDTEKTVTVTTSEELNTHSKDPLVTWVT